jgi:hypothetical protein
MKTTNRIQKHIAINHTTPQSSKQRGNKSAPTVAGAAPNFERLQLQDALALMESTGQASCVALVVLAENIKFHSKAFAGWEWLNIPGKEEGIMELAQIIVSDFNLSLDSLKNDVNAEFLAVRVDHNAKFKNSLNLENAVGELRGSITMLSDILSEHQGNTKYQVHHYLGFSLSQKLDNAFNCLWSAIGAFNQKMRAEVVS